MSSPARRRHPNWTLALSLLSRVCPGSTGFDPDDIDGLGPGSWTPIDPCASTDVEIAQFLRAAFGPVESDFVVVVTFASYQREVGPFFVDASGLDELIARHADLFDDPFFSGDVTIMDAENGVVRVIHHDGLVAELAGHPACGSSD